MNKSREKHLQEIGELRRAIEITKSLYAKRDLRKGLHRKLKELAMYDRLYEKGRMEEPHN